MREEEGTGEGNNGEGKPRGNRAPDNEGERSRARGEKQSKRKKAERGEVGEKVGRKREEEENEEKAEPVSHAVSDPAAAGDIRQDKALLAFAVATTTSFVALLGELGRGQGGGGCLSSRLSLHQVHCVCFRLR